MDRVPIRVGLSTVQITQWSVHVWPDTARGTWDVADRYEGGLPSRALTPWNLGHHGTYGCDRGYLPGDAAFWRVPGAWACARDCAGPDRQTRVAELQKVVDLLYRGDDCDPCRLGRSKVLVTEREDPVRHRPLRRGRGAASNSDISLRLETARA